MARCVEIRVRGIVQGVGFRPFIFRIAHEYRINGTVWNDTWGVLIHAEGAADDVEGFIREIEKNPPPLAIIQSVETTDTGPCGCGSFTIDQSRVLESRSTFIPPDTCLCEECRRELFDPANPRFRYPFITCTHCGPRFSIVEDIPYDRSRTSMAGFEMCPLCRREYEDPRDRRFHTQPTACPVCGPHLALHHTDGSLISRDIGEIIGLTLKGIGEGKIFAIKGTGGYLLAADARNDAAVIELRRRKGRPFKPFALMAGSIEAIAECLEISEAERDLLLSKERPIVLLKEKRPFVSPHVAPSIPFHGVMLPYMPFHYQLFERDPNMVLIMTSGNVSEEPIIFRDEDAFSHLAPIADYIISYNRAIVSQTDDSVIFVENERQYFIRRSRGYVPVPFHSDASNRQILATGGDLKNSFALSRRDTVIMSQYLGDLATPSGNRLYRDTVDRFQKIYDFAPEVVVSDMHPGYFTTAIADEFEKKGLARMKVQHHHAHIASVLEDRGISGPVIGIAFDGTGYGTDGALWGSEFLVADRRDFRRAAHFSYFPLPGGERAIREVWKIGVSLLHLRYGRNIPLMKEKPQNPMLFEIMEKGINSPLTCSIGRIFDGVAAILGIADTISTEAEAAQLLEVAAMKGAHDPQEAFVVPFDSTEPMVLNTGALVEYLVGLTRQGESVERVAFLFHYSLAKTTEKIVEIISAGTEIRTVVLSGGVFHNRLLLKMLLSMLGDSGYEVCLPEKVPVNDEGIALGQIAVAKERLRYEPD